MSVAAAQKHIANIERKVGKSNNIAAKGKDMKLGDAIKLGRKSNSIVSEIKKGISEYDGTDPTPAEAKSILDAMSRVVDGTEKQLNLLVSNQARYEELHVGGLVKRNVTKTDTASKELSKVLLAKAPADMKSQAEALEARRAKAFDGALKAFANAQGGEDQAEGEDDSD